MCYACQFVKAKLLLNREETNSFTKTKDTRSAREQECFFDAQTMHSSEFLCGSGRYDHLTQNRRRSAEIQVGLLFKAKDLGFSEKNGVGAEQTNTS